MKLEIRFKRLKEVSVTLQHHDDSELVHQWSYFTVEVAACSAATVINSILKDGAALEGIRAAIGGEK